LLLTVTVDVPFEFVTANTGPAQRPASRAGDVDGCVGAGVEVTTRVGERDGDRILATPELALATALTSVTVPVAVPRPRWSSHLRCCRHSCSHRRCRNRFGVAPPFPRGFGRTNAPPPPPPNHRIRRRRSCCSRLKASRSRLADGEVRMSVSSNPSATVKLDVLTT
jgi:hypothetical protein